MTERQHKIVCAFYHHSPRVSAHDMHGWVYETLHLQASELLMIQTDGPLRYIYIKFRDPQRMQVLLTEIQGQGDFRYENGEISKVRIEAVGLCVRRVKLANLPPEVADRTLKMALGAYGEIREIQTDTWSNAYRYPVTNGIRVVEMKLIQHIPSHMVVAGQRTLISQEGSRQTLTAVTNQVIYKPRARIDDVCERRTGRHSRRHGRKWRQTGPVRPPRAAVEEAGMTVIENTETETTCK
jgi:hypothetical protein